MPRCVDGYSFILGLEVGKNKSLVLFVGCCLCLFQVVLAILGPLHFPYAF